MDTAEKLAEVVGYQADSVFVAGDDLETKTAEINNLKTVADAHAAVLEAETKLEEAKDSNKHNKRTLVWDITKGVFIIVVTIWGTAIGYEFEKTGTETSATFKRFRNFTDRFTR
jgi:hypothetical protein